MNRRIRLFLLMVLAGCTGTEIAPAPLDAPVPSGLTSARFVVYGDSRPTGLPIVWERKEKEEARLVIDRIAQAAPHLVLHSGDLVFSGESSRYWEQFDEWHKPLRDRNIPFFPVLGNHEYIGSNRTAMKNFFGRFPQLDGRMWYDVRLGSLLFLMLNSNFNQLSRSEIRAQDRWLEEQLRQARDDTQIRGIILVCHHPPYTNAIFSKSDKDVQGHFVSRIVGHPKVKAFFVGHVHSYERFLIDGIQYVVSGGGGAPLAPLQQDPKKMTYRDLCPTQDRRYHICLGHLTDETLRFEVWNLSQDQKWSVMDEFTIPLTDVKK